MCPSLIEIGSKTAEKNSAQTNRHYENNGHLAVNQKYTTPPTLLTTFALSLTNTSPLRPNFISVQMVLLLYFVNFGISTLTLTPWQPVPLQPHHYTMRYKTNIYSVLKS